MAPLANNMGLFVATPSYNGRIAFSIVCERSIMPDIAFFRECIDESFADLMAAVPKPEKPKAATATPQPAAKPKRSEEHTSELQSLMRISYAVFCLKKKKKYEQTKVFK